MSTEQSDPPVLAQPEENQSVAKPTLFWKRKKTWGPSLVVLVFVLTSLIGAYFYRPNLTQLLNEPGSGGSMLGSWYRSNIGNIRFILPGGWAVSNNANLSLPVGFRDPIFILKKTGSACIIARAEQDADSAKALKQISFADRVFSDYAQYDGDWWIAATGDSAKYSFSENVRQYIAGEFRISSSRNEPFVLFMSDGTAVPDDCNSDFNALLKTVEPYYEVVQLNPSSAGVMITEKVWDDSRRTVADQEKSYEHLIYMADGSKEKREVMLIPTGTWAGSFFVFGNKLYIPANSYQPSMADKKARFDSAIYVLDPFTGQKKQIPGTISTNAHISSLYLRDDVIYYLMGSSELGTCLDGYRKCLSDLYSIPLTGGKPTLVAHSSLGGVILGYVESEGAFYIRQSWGDAGYSTTIINKIIGAKETSVGEFNSYSGESEADKITYKQTMDKINAIKTRAGAMKILSEGVRIDNGSLHPASNDISGDAKFYFDK